jgi:hypothetical protein
MRPMLIVVLADIAAVAIAAALYFWLSRYI